MDKSALKFFVVHFHYFVGIWLLFVSWEVKMAEIKQQLFVSVRKIQVFEPNDSWLQNGSDKKKLRVLFFYFLCNLLLGS